MSSVTGKLDVDVARGLEGLAVYSRTLGTSWYRQIFHLQPYLGHALVAAEHDMLLIVRLVSVRVDTAFLLRDLRMVLRHC